MQLSCHVALHNTAATQYFTTVLLMLFNTKLICNTLQLTCPATLYSWTAANCHATLYNWTAMQHSSPVLPCKTLQPSGHAPLNNRTVPDVTMTYIRGWMQMVYCHMIYSPETEQIRQWDIWIRRYRILVISTYKMVTTYSQYITNSMHNGSVLSRLNLLPVFPVAPWGCCFLLCWWSTAYLVPRLGGRALPHSPHPGSSGSTNLPASLSDTRTFNSFSHHFHQMSPNFQQ